MSIRRQSSEGKPEKVIFTPAHRGHGNLGFPNLSGESEG